MDRSRWRRQAYGGALGTHRWPLRDTAAGRKERGTAGSLSDEMAARTRVKRRRAGMAQDGETGSKLLGRLVQTCICCLHHIRVAFIFATDARNECFLLNCYNNNPFPAVLLPVFAGALEGEAGINRRDFRVSLPASRNHASGFLIRAETTSTGSPTTLTPRPSPAAKPVTVAGIPHPALGSPASHAKDSRLAPPP
jgi:hypothetical protein